MHVRLLTATLLAALVAVSLRAESPRDRTVVFRLQPATIATTLPERGQVRLRSATGGETIEWAIDHGVAQGKLAVGSHWFTDVLALGWWAATDSLSVAAGDGPQANILTVWRTGHLRGRLQLSDPKSKRPSTFAITVESPPVRRVRTLPPGSSVECAVGSDSRWNCEVPAGVLDLAIRAKSFIPVYRWDLRIDPGGTRDAGTIVLKPGSSLSGWVATEEKRKEPLAARVRLLRMAPAMADPRLRERFDRPVAATLTSGNGFFQLQSLEPGKYQVTADSPGLAPATLYPVEVYAAAETAIKPLLTLKPPLAVRISVSPPQDWLGKPWQVAVARRGDFTGIAEDPPAFDGVADASGLVTVRAQPPGMFQVTVSDSQNNPMASEEFSVVSDLDPPHAVTVRNLHVTGKVFLGESPLPSATLHFGGRYGDEHFTASSDSEGNFQAVLARAGNWTVEVVLDGDVATEVPVAVEPDSHGEATVTIRLPDNRVEGVVLDTDGGPVYGAMVRLDRNPPGHARSGRDGHFLFRSVAPGAAQLSATSGMRSEVRSTEVVQVNVAESGLSGPFELHVKPAGKLAGQVVSPRGPVPGALVTLMTRESSPPFLTNATADLEGNFSSSVPTGVSSITGIVSPPGYALRLFDIPLGDRPVVLNVTDAGGTLRVHLPPPAPGPMRALVIFSEGRPLPSDVLYHWGLSHGAPVDRDSLVWEIPQLAPGTYSICTLPLPGSGDSQRCREGAVVPGGVLDLDLGLR